MTANYPDGANTSRAPWNRPSCTRCGADTRAGEDLCEACSDYRNAIEAEVRDGIIAGLEAQASRVAKGRPRVCEEANAGYCHTDGQRSALDFAVRLVRGESVIGPS